MKKLSVILLFLLPTLAAFMFNGCKYEDGPALSFKSRKERVANTWQLDKYLVNGVDNTLNYNTLYSTARWTFNKNGGLMYSYVLPDTIITAVGNWEFTSNDDAINLRFINLLDTIKQTVTILKLKEKELWFKYTDTTQVTYETHLGTAN